MIDKAILLEKLAMISRIIQERYVKETEIGVLTGISGMALFQLYYAKFLNSDSYNDIGLEMLSNCIKKIEIGDTDSSFHNGIAGTGWVLDHLGKENFIDAVTTNYYKN